MKKIALLFVLLCFGIATYAQKFVVTIPQLRNVVLEEYTGIHCGYCPDGHARAEALMNENAGRVVLINIHQGNFANPGAGEPDFRTPFGDSLAADAGVSGYPNGAVNRHVFPEIEPAKAAMGRTTWGLAASKIFILPSPVNVGFKSTFDTLTRILSVEVEVYYTENSPMPENYLNIALLENHVIGYQSDYANGNHTDYDHKHILRHLLTGQWGEKITKTSKGSLFTKIFHYTVPSNIVVKNCDVAVFVTETKKEIYTGVVSKADGGMNDGHTVVFYGDVLNNGKKLDKGVKNTEKTFELQLLSKLPGNEDYKISMETDAPLDWQISFGIDGTWYTKEIVKSLQGDITKDVTIKVKPGDTAFVATIRLFMESIKYPGTKRLQTVYYMSGVTELVINNSAAWGNGGDTTANVFKTDFLQGLKFAGCNSFTSTSSDVINLSAGSNFLEDIKNIYFNVGWSFPALTDELVSIFENFINKGGNIMFSGQDIGWDIFDQNGHGTTMTKAFLTNFFKTGYINDGDQSNNNLYAVANDAVFGTIQNSQIVNRYGVNPDNNVPYMYPDVLSALSGGKSVLYYNNNISKVAAVRSVGQSYKTFLLGVSLEMISDENVRKNLMKITYDWFIGSLSDVEFDVAMENLWNVYPNPVLDILNIDNTENKLSFIELLNVQGEEVIKYKPENGLNQINMLEFPSGIYLLRLVDRSGNNKTIKIKR